MNVRSLCVDYMKDNEEHYSQFIDHDHLNFTMQIDRLKLDGSWGGNPEITALSQVFACPIEVYQDSEIPRVFESENSDGKTNHIIRIYYANSHDSSVRPNGQGGHLFNFQVLQPGDLQKQIALLQEAHNPQKDIISDNNLSDEEKAEKLSKVIAEAFNNYLTFYATRLIKLELPKKNNILSLKRNRRRKMRYLLVFIKQKVLSIELINNGELEVKGDSSYYLLKWNNW